MPDAGMPTRALFATTKEDLLAGVSEVAPLNSLVFPEDSGVRRDHAVPQAWRGPEHDRLYDFRTLAYDAIACPQEHAVVLVCPKLFNFEAIVRAGKFSISGKSLKVRSVRKHRRFDEILLDWEGTEGNLVFEHDGLVLTTGLSSRELEDFRGLNVMIAISRNNSLRWIRDWVAYHIHAHSLQAVVLIDNASDRYSPSELAAVLAGIPGLKAFRVVTAPFSYGPLGIVRRRFQSKFLQVAMFNAVRRRFLAEAAAILSVDVDELVHSKTGKSVFSAARNSLLGYVAFRGSWAFRDPSLTNEPLHAQHVLREANGDKCPYKYCFIPGGWIGRRPLEVHGIAGRWINRLASINDFGYWHCFSVTTNWKNARSTSAGRKLEPDPFADEAMKRYLPLSEE
jgi:hypothetical protein